jgi:hypothetical protein
VHGLGIVGFPCERFGADEGDGSIDWGSAAHVIDQMENPWYLVHDIGELFGEDLPIPCINIWGCGGGGVV